jgi:MFS superfamily sulfate permease-like transporter
VRWFVLDAAAISDLDSTGAEALENVGEELHRRGIVFALARAEPPLPDLLRTYGLLERIGPERLYPTARDAVTAFRAERGRPDTAAGGTEPDASPDAADA